MIKISLYFSIKIIHLKYYVINYGSDRGKFCVFINH